MKKLSLEMLRLTSDEVLGRSQMKKITGGSGGGAWICTCGNNPPITVWDGDASLDNPNGYADPTQICTDVYNTNGSCSPANP